MRFASLVAGLALLLLTACAAPGITPVQGESLAGLRTEKVAVNYTLATKKINYIETLYRVLWLETKTSTQDFSGLWDPDAHLTASATTKLRQQGFAASSIHEALDAKAVTSENQAWGALLVANATRPHPTIANAKLIPPREFFLDSQATATLKPLAAQLREKGFRYLVQMSAMDINGNAPGYGLVVVGADLMIQVVDLNTGKIIWASPTFQSEPYQLGGDLKALEIDGMKKTKEGLAAGIAKINFEDMWGLQLAKK